MRVKRRRQEADVLLAGLLDDHEALEHLRGDLEVGALHEDDGESDEHHEDEAGEGECDHPEDKGGLKATHKVADSDASARRVCGDLRRRGR